MFEARPCGYVAVTPPPMLTQHGRSLVHCSAGLGQGFASISAEGSLCVTTGTRDLLGLQHGRPAGPRSDVGARVTRAEGAPRSVRAAVPVKSRASAGVAAMPMEVSRFSAQEPDAACFGRHRCAGMYADPPSVDPGVEYPIGFAASSRDFLCPLDRRLAVGENSAGVESRGRFEVNKCLATLIHDPPQASSLARDSLLLNESLDSRDQVPKIPEDQTPEGFRR